LPSLQPSRNKLIDKQRIAASIKPANLVLIFMG